MCGNFAWILLYGHLSRDAIWRIRQHFTTFSIASIIMYVFFMSHDKVIKCINSRTYFRLVSIIHINHFSGIFFLLIQLHPKAYAQEYQYFLYLISEMGQSQTIKLNWFLLGYIHQIWRNIWGQWGSVPSYYWKSLTLFRLGWGRLCPSHCIGLSTFDLKMFRRAFSHKKKSFSADWLWSVG
jgi:hypothetical protein